MSDKDYRNFITRLSGNHYTKAQVDRKVARRKKMRELWAKAVPADTDQQSSIVQTLENENGLQQPAAAV